MNGIGILLALVCGSVVVYAVWALVKEASLQHIQQALVLPYIAKYKEEPEVAAEIASDNFSVGYSFERFIVSRFQKEYFTLHDWRSDKSHDGIYALSNLYPDLKYEFHHHAKRIFFAVECKWRKDFYNNGIELKPEHIDNYIDYEQEENEKVFIAIGVKGTPAQPEFLFVFPLNDIDEDTSFLSRDFLNTYQKVPTSNFFFDPYRQKLC